MANSHLKLVTPTTEKRTVTPTRRPNAEIRTREYLTDAEVDKLTEAAKGNRYGHRDATMVLVAYRHGVRASELVDLRWDQIDFNTATLAVRRTKNGSPSTHPIKGDELSALRPNMSASAAITLRCVEVLPCRRNRLNAGRVGVDGTGITAKRRTGWSAETGSNAGRS